MTKDPLLKYISVVPDICHGKPTFRIGSKPSRIMVWQILELLEAGISAGEITSEKYFPKLTPTHIRAALHFAAEQMKNRQSIAFSR